MTVSSAERLGSGPTICISIDVERDYRADRELSLRGVEEGLPVFLDLLKSHTIPFDLMISGEIADRVPREVYLQNRSRCALGCHGQDHDPGYLNRLDSKTQEAKLRHATEAIAARFGRSPQVFRAPNFGASGETLRILARLAYRADSSVLPGRNVKRWRVRTLVDHRGVPEDPYHPDLSAFPQPGSGPLLEVPVTPNRFLPGGPLGLGFLHAYGHERFRATLAVTLVRYVVFLAHTWEMVDWQQGDRVAPWVRQVARSSPRELESLISSLDGAEYINMEEIVRRENGQLGSP